MLNSTRNWKPLINGYSGFIPPGMAAAPGGLRAFRSPKPWRLCALQA
jgi:hypothetical protein